MNPTPAHTRRKFIAALAGSLPVAAMAGGGMTGGSTEVTQIANKLQLAMAYAKQVAQHVTELAQLQTQLTNLIKNPLSLLGPEIGNMINDIGKIMSIGKSIGSNLAQIDKNFGTMFKSSTALSLSESFTNWHHTSIDTLEGALKSAGLHMYQYKDDTSRIQALYLASQQTGGNLEALQTLSKINIEQIQQTQRLGNLIATQNLAASTYMAEHASRAQATQKAGEINFKAVPLPDRSTYKNPTF
jgi:P-type conjugative transfer protein TrbJ